MLKENMFNRMFSNFTELFLERNEEENPDFGTFEEFAKDLLLNHLPSQDPFCSPEDYY